VGQREATAFALLPLILAGVVLLPPWVYLAAVWIVGMLAAWELLAMLRRKGFSVPRVPTIVALGVAMPLLWWGGLAMAGPLLAAVILALPLVYLLGRYPIEGAAGAMTGSAFAAAYFATTAGAMGFLRTSFVGSIGWKVVLLHCLTIWGGDSGAYYLGSRLGRHRLAPRVSPKKSWEGVVGGVAGTLIGVAVCRFAFFRELPLPAAGAVVVLLAVLAPLGDLVESLFKRDAGIKDSSTLIPGHGGFLDRTDSLFFAAPFVLALLLLLRVGG
jgi:phosphatidate cytidylyltransferase